MAGKDEQTPPTARACRPRSGMSDIGATNTAEFQKSLRRSGSLRLRGEAVPTGTPSPRREKTADSLRPRRARSFRSAASTPEPAGRGACSLPPSPALSRRSSTADSSWETRSLLGAESPFSTEGIARNGTTFSSRCNKYVVHCAKRVDDEHYLTPTQRTTRDLKRLRALLDKAHDTIRERDAEVNRLKQEIVFLRLRGTSSHDATDAPADLGAIDRVSDLNGHRDEADCVEHGSSFDATEVPSPTSKSACPAPTADEPEMSTTDKPTLLPSVCDSGNFDCLTSPSVSSKESGDKMAGMELEQRLGDDWEETEHWIEWEEKRLREESERRITELNRQHASEYQEMKEKYNDKVEGLLQKLTEANSRYFELRPLYDASRLRVGQLELQLETTRVRAERRDARDGATQTSAAPILVAAQSQTPQQPAQMSAQSQTPQQSVQVPAQSQTPQQSVQVAAQSQTTAELAVGDPVPAAAELAIRQQPTQVAAQSPTLQQLATNDPVQVAARAETLQELSQAGSSAITDCAAANAGDVTDGGVSTSRRGPCTDGSTDAEAGADGARVGPRSEAADAERLLSAMQSLCYQQPGLSRQSLYCQQLAVLEDSRLSSDPASREMDPPMRLQFLKSAVFHYLTDREEYAGHMRAISAVLQFSDWERQEVERVRARKLSHA
ncbi:uncharacterized protein LOC119102959 [Pollicipes pollicipes]|uniref:uncharacterized protein LOC119102959 n=1 Tax=Pollicipes pollicipes TaxID=41117 RepID=UPI00188570EA|nr:uncharacterized protein LOC119102959 [Pollicipes pollicipes]